MLENFHIILLFHLVAEQEIVVLLCCVRMYSFDHSICALSTLLPLHVSEAASQIEYIFRSQVVATLSQFLDHYQNDASLREFQDQCSDLANAPDRKGGLLLSGYLTL
jgi:hypothetical protein